MKKFLMSMGAAVLVAFSINTHALTVDTLEGMAFLENSSDESEIIALADTLMYDPSSLTLEGRYESPLPMYDEVENYWYIAAPDEPGYFSLKFGIGGTDVEYNTFFFSNMVELDFLVFTDEQIMWLCTLECGSGEGRLSFYTVSAVPLPAAFWMFGSALMGLLVFARRRNQHASYA